MVTSDTADRFSTAVQVVVSGDSVFVGWIIYASITLVLGLALMTLLYRITLHGFAKTIVAERERLQSLLAQHLATAEAGALLIEGRKQDLELMEKLRDD